jgi:hypothetical protein
VQQTVHDVLDSITITTSISATLERQNCLSLAVALSHVQSSIASFFAPA